MLLCDFGSLPQVAIIDKLFDGNVSEHHPVIHPHTTLALLKGAPHVNKFSIALGSGVEHDWLLDAAGEFEATASILFL